MSIDHELLKNRTNHSGDNRDDLFVGKEFLFCKIIPIYGVEIFQTNTS